MTSSKNIHELSEEQRKNFDKLTEKRKKSIEVYKEDGMIDVLINLIVDTYRDSAHFVYELLQNADDAEATSVWFILDKKGLFFSHNGKIHFSVSDPSVERNSKAGHINAITTFSLSTKTSDASKTENKIGKFGIGFKSVFQYTSTPQIYNPPFLFEIQEYMIPVEIDMSYQEWLDDKEVTLDADETTAFYLPFNSNNRDREQAYEDIRKKLEELDNPLLFLNHLKLVQWQTQSKQGHFTKSIETSFEEISDLYDCEATRTNIDDKSFYVFSRLSQFGYKYSIAYPLDKNGNVDFSDKYNGYTDYAYCFFPTRQEARAKFLIHAPFILTPNREGIKENKKENECLINQLAKLSVDSLLICKELQLVNDRFFNILPINYDRSGNKDNIFRPIYEAIALALRTQEILPINNGEDFVQSISAYWANSKDLRELLSYNNFKPLRDLYNDQSAQLVFSTVAERSSDLVSSYIVKDGDLVRYSITPDKMVTRLNQDFICKQDFEWIIKMYKFFDNQGTWLFEKLKKEPIIILEGYESNSYKATSPLSFDNKPKVFLSTNPPHSRPTVHKYFEENAKDFLLRIGIRQPQETERIKDIIYTYNQISVHEKYGFTSVKYKTIKELLNEFEAFIEFYKNISYNFNRKYDFICDLKKEKFIVTNQSVIDSDSNQVKYLSEPNNDLSRIYLPSEELIQYFDGYANVKFFNRDFYKSIYDKYSEEYIHSFLKELGLQDRPITIECDYDYRHGNIDYLREEYGFKKRSTKTESVVDYTLEGLDNALSNINTQTSRFIFTTLKFLYVVSAYYKSESIKSTIRQQGLPPKFVDLLQNRAWIYDSNNNLRKPSEIFVQDMSDIYDLTDSRSVIERLGIPSRPPVSIEDIEKDFGFSQKEILEILQREKCKQDLETKITDDDISSETTQKIENTTKKLIKGARRKFEQPKPFLENNIELVDIDDDELSPSSIDIHKEIKAINEATEQKIAEIITKTKLEEIVENSEKYTFAWFKALLELEYSCASEDQVKKNPLQVVFKKVEREANTDNTIILSETTSIPNRLEDVGDLQIDLNFKNNENKSVQVEAVSLQKWILKAKLKNISELDGINLGDVESAVIKVKNPDFILEKLRNSFTKLPFVDEDNLQDQLPKNIEFVFGPPGTGKTTYLVKEEILQRAANPEFKILVLTPTNKAADVLTKRLMQESPSYTDWLVRYGITKDNEIANSPIFKTKEIAGSAVSKLVLVTTTARFPYDNFRIENQDGEKLKDFNWDYIIFDEASMISLASIVYTIYYVNKRKPDCKFIVGGDPFQLSPVIHVAHDSWKDGNIYTLVGLDQEDSFINPDTKPHKYTVKHLETQYRSIATVGKLFSEFRYNDKLKHHRSDTDINEIEVVKLPLEPVTIIDFKVSRFESIYKPRKVKGSNYQIYSAILTVELIKYILENITIQNENKYRIGVICPYRIQANIIDKLLSKLVIASEIEIITGTVHSFQGDECEMIINLLNPPLGISESEEIFLNKKNLLNVSISRAKDYLILLMPVDKSQSIQTDKLKHINTIRTLSSSVSISYNSEDIEEVILGGKNMIEDFSFPTTHQDVNVYVEPEKKYEIRYDDNAVDIQVKL